MPTHVFYFLILFGSFSPMLSSASPDEANQIFAMPIFPSGESGYAETPEFIANGLMLPFLYARNSSSLESGEWLPRHYTQAEREAYVARIQSYERLLRERLGAFAERIPSILPYVSRYKPSRAPEGMESDIARFSSMFGDNNEKLSHLLSQIYSVIKGDPLDFTNKRTPVNWLLVTSDPRHEGGDAIAGGNLGQSNEDLPFYVMNDSRTWAVKATERLLQTMELFDVASKDALLISEYFKYLKSVSELSPGQKWLSKIFKENGPKRIQELIRAVGDSVIFGVLAHELAHFLDMPQFNIRHIESEIYKDPAKYLLADGSLNMEVIIQEGLVEDQTKRVELVERRGFSIDRVVATLSLALDMDGLASDALPMEDLQTAYSAIYEILKFHREIHKPGLYQESQPLHFTGRFKNRLGHDVSPVDENYVLYGGEELDSGLSFYYGVGHFMKTQLISDQLFKLDSTNRTEDTQKLIETVKNSMHEFYQRFLHPKYHFMVRYMPLTKFSLKLSMIKQFQTLLSRHSEHLNGLSIQVSESELTRSVSIESLIALQGETHQQISAVYPKFIKSKISLAPNCSQYFSPNLTGQ